MQAKGLEELLAQYGAIIASWVKSSRVRKAFATVPRHVFVERGVYLPNGQGGLVYRPVNQEVLEYIYSDRPLVIKKSPCVSSSQPALLAIMLELLDLAPGLRVLEIGTGTGYFAALIAEIVGDSRLVTTVEIQPDVAAWAREALDKAGYSGVSVRVRDGIHGCPENAPYDRIVVSTCSSDVSPEWLRQLAPDGWLLVPLKHGGKYSAPLVRVTKDGIAKVCEWAGFGPALGALYHSGPWSEIEDYPTTRTGVTLHNERLLFPVPANRKYWLFDFHFFLALNDPATCWIDWLDKSGKCIGILHNDNLSDLLVIREDQGWCVQVAGSKELGDRLVHWFQEFMDLGAPGMADYEIEFTFLQEAKEAGIRRLAERQWLITRRFSQERIYLP